LGLRGWISGGAHGGAPAVVVFMFMGLTGRINRARA
jgi:hypothetical protein